MTIETDERTGEWKGTVGKEEFLSALKDHRRTLEVLSDIDAGLCVLSYSDYLRLPATFVDAARLFRVQRKQLQQKLDGSLGT